MHTVNRSINKKIYLKIVEHILQAMRIKFGCGTQRVSEKAAVCVLRAQAPSTVFSIIVFAGNNSLYQASLRSGFA